MKRLPAFSYAIFVLLLMVSSSLAASAFQNQASRERELSAALATGSGVIVIGGDDDIGFTFKARNRMRGPFAILDGAGDPIMINGFQNHNYNPARDGFMNNPARGSFMHNAPLRR